MIDRRNIKRIYLKTARKVKDFLLSDKSREFLIFLFFFFIASGFWLLQTLNNDYETEFSIPVRLKGVPNNVVITSEPPSELHIRVKDKGTVLLNYMLGKSFFPITLDFSDYKGTDNHVRIYSSQFEKRLLNQLNVSTKLLSVKPDTLEYIYSTGASKLVPVKFQGTVSAGRQYYISDTVCKPDSVLAYAPEGALDTITVAYTRKVKFEDISDTLRQQVPLLAPRGIKFVPASVEMVFPVDIYTEKTVEVPLRGVNFPAGKVLRAFPSKVSVTFQVGLSRFNKITEIGITGGIGSGKSLVSRLLEVMGIPVYISDIESKRLTNSDALIRRELIALLGEEVYAGDELNKPLLASYIFGDPEHIRTVNSIIHPRVRDDFRQWVERHTTYPVVGMESAILIEAGFAGEVDAVVLVYAPEELRIMRAMQRDTAPRELIERRVRSQMSDEEKRTQADFVIVNDGKTPLIPQVLEVITSLSKNIAYLCLSENRLHLGKNK